MMVTQGVITDDGRDYWAHIKPLSAGEPYPPNIRPKLVVASIGSLLMPGTAEAIGVAIKHCSNEGYDVAYTVIHDIVIKAPLGISEMRNFALIVAVKAKADWLIILDNDIMPEPDSFVKLLRVNRPVVFPWLDQSPFTDTNKWERLGWPMVQPNQGIVPVEWAVWSCVLMSGPFLRMVGPNFFSGDMVTNYDDYLCKKMGFYGFSPWLDSDTIIKLLRPPGKIWEFWQDKNPNPNTAEHRAEVDNIIKTVMSAPLHVPDA